MPLFPVFEPPPVLHFISVSCGFRCPDVVLRSRADFSPFTTKKTHVCPPTTFGQFTSPQHKHWDNRNSWVNMGGLSTWDNVDGVGR